jgi:hypothetical protein
MVRSLFTNHLSLRVLQKKNSTLRKENSKNEIDQ